MIFLLGVGAYVLKLAAVSKLIEELDINNYPILMIMMAFSFLASMFFLERAQRKLNFLYTQFLLFTSIALVIAFNYQSTFNIIHVDKGISNWSGLAIFLLSNVIVNSLRLTIQTKAQNSISVLERPNLSGHFAFLEELGIVFGAMIGALFPLSHSPLTYTLLISPFLALGALNLLIKNKKIQYQEQPVMGLNGSSQKVGLRFQFPFLTGFIFLMILISFMKQGQNFAYFTGIDQLKSMHQTYSTTQIISWVFVIQTVFTLLFLVPSFFRKINTGVVASSTLR